MQFGKKINKNNKGFTLIELIITVVILALVTAPFLSSFATASRTNLKSKRIQEANELGEYIIEQFKATTVDQLIKTYNLSQDSSYVISGNTKTSTKYTGTMAKSGSGATLPAGFRSGYTANITLTPAKVVTNEDNAIPVVDKLNKEDCAVFVNNITKYDALYTGASRRKVSVEISKDSVYYNVALTVDILSSTGSNLGSNSITWRYKTVPSVYMLYKPLSNMDEIVIKNSISDVADLTVDGKKKNVNVYIINQKETATSYYSNLSGDNVTIYEAYGVGLYNNYSLKSLADPGLSAAKLDNTTVYTNIVSTSTDKNGSLNNSIKMIKIDTVYNLDVTVNYDGKKVSDYNSTKVVGE